MKVFIFSFLIFSMTSCNVIKIICGEGSIDKDFSNCTNCSSGGGGTGGSSGNVNLQTSLLAFYDFEGGTLGDDTSNSNLTLVWTGGGYTTQTGPHSATALDCANSSSGNSLHATPSSVLSMGTSTDYSIAFWAYFPASPGPSAALLDWNNSAQTQVVSFDGANKMTFSADGVSIAGSATVTQNVWTHYAIVVDRDVGMSLYINGSLDSSNANTSSANNLSSDRLQICSRGSAGGGNSPLTNVYLDNIGIWGKVLSASDLSDLASGQTPF